MKRSWNVWFSTFKNWTPEPHRQQHENLVLVGESISLSILAEFDVSHIKGLISTRGGTASHLTILARSLRIPMVTAIDNLSLLGSGKRVLIDGNRGLVLVEPESVTFPDHEPEERDKLDPDEWKALSETVTLDGERVSLLANTELDLDLDHARAVAAEGVGLFRTEYLFMSRKDGPINEEEQFQRYQSLAQLLAGRPAYVRTLDIGDEGHPYFLELAGEDEPLLGLRGIRLGLDYPEILIPQLRAILRAAEFGDLRIVFPMISSAAEFARAREIVDQVLSDLRNEGHPVRTDVQVGAMLEVPAAIFCLRDLVELADFFLVGTNDLVQYTLAVGRNNQRVAHLFQPFHPAVLAILTQIIAVTTESETPVIVCGEMAGQPRSAALLVGLGFRQLSMNPMSIDAVRAEIQGVSTAELRLAAEHVLTLQSPRQIEQFVRETPFLAPRQEPQSALEGKST